MSRRIKQAFALLLVMLVAVIVVACDGDNVPAQYTVTFVAGENATVTPETTTVVSGMKITAPTASKTGYTLAGWYKEAAFTNEWVFATDTVTANISLYAKWNQNSVAQYTVTFNANGGTLTTPASVSVNPGSKVSEPTISKADHSLTGWYTDDNVKWVFEVNPVNANLNLTAKWELNTTGTAIRSQQEFYDLVAGETVVNAGDNFYLANDLDFADFPWDFPASPKEFPGNFNGNNKTISNLTISGSGIGGIFQKVTGGKISYLTIDNAHITSTGNRAGILAGQLDIADGSVFDNITIIDSYVKGTSSEGVGALIGQVKWAVEISNIVVLNTEIVNDGQAAGGLVGLFNGNQNGAVAFMNIKNVLLDVTVTTLNDKPNAGGVIGETSNLDPENGKDWAIDGLVLRATVTSARYSAGIVGKNAKDTAEEKGPSRGSVKNAILMVNIYNNAGTNLNDLGYLAGRPLGFSETQNVYLVASNIGSLAPKGTNAPTAVLADVSDITLEHLAGFDASWDLEAGSLPELNNLSIDLGHKVTLSILDDSRVLYVNDGALLPMIVVQASGKRFDDWKLGEEIFDTETDVVEADITLVAQFTDIVTVSFDTAGGSAVADKPVEAGSTITAPETTKAGYNFVRWELVPGEAFNFETEITADITLVAVWVDDIAPVLTISPDPEDGEVPLLPNTNFVLTITMNDANPSKVVVTSSLFSLTVLADEANPLGEAKEEIEASGITVTYNAATKVWTINLGEDITDDILEADSIAVTFVGHDAHENVSAETTLTYAVSLADVKFTVTFNTNGGSTIPVAEVFENTTLTLPAAPTKEGFTFGGWFTDALLETPFVASTPITGNITLYAKWNEKGDYEPDPNATAITTAQEFNDAIKVNGNYYLAADIDFTGFTWSAATGTFTGTLDGNFKTISNLTISGDGRMGIFRSAKGITVKNLILDNVNVDNTGAERSGIIVAEVVKDAAAINTFSNITVLNSSVSANHANGAGVLAGMGQGHLEVDNIYISNTDVSNAKTAAGALFGMLDGDTHNLVMNFSNIYVENAEISAPSRVGLFGETKKAIVTLNISNVVMVDTTLLTTAGNAAALSGYININIGTLDSFVFNGSITGTEKLGEITAQNSIPSSTNAFLIATTFTGAIASKTNATDKLAEVQAQTWWTANLPNIASNPLWQFNATTSFYELVR